MAFFPSTSYICSEITVHVFFQFQNSFEICRFPLYLEDHLELLLVVPGGLRQVVEAHDALGEGDEAVAVRVQDAEQVASVLVHVPAFFSNKFFS